MENKLITQTVYVPVDVKERKPNKTIRCQVSTIVNGTSYERRASYFLVQDKWECEFFQENEIVTHWLEKKEDQTVLSKDELRTIIGNAQMVSFDWGVQLCSFETCAEISNNYIDNLLNEKVNL